MTKLKAILRSRQVERDRELSRYVRQTLGNQPIDSLGFKLYTAMVFYGSYEPLRTYSKLVRRGLNIEEVVTELAKRYPRLNYLVSFIENGELEAG